MITLYGFGPYFDLPDQSPLVMKTEIQLRMAGLAYRKDFGGMLNAPKGKLPYLRDGDQLIADSTFIRAHIERTYQVDLDRGLSAKGRATAWAIERMLEDHLSWAITHLRWVDDERYRRGPLAQLFSALPEAARPKVAGATRQRLLAALQAQGFGRHSEAEVTELCERSLAALSELLGDNSYLMGGEPVGVDATAFGVVACLATEFFDAPVTRAARSFPRLVAYRDRMLARYYPDLASS